MAAFGRVARLDKARFVRWSFYAVIMFALVLPVTILTAVHGTDATYLFDVKKKLELAWFILSLFFFVTAMIFIAKFWDRPIMALSQRTLMVIMALCLTVDAAMHQITKITTTSIPACYGKHITWYAAMNMFFAILTVKEWRIYKIHKMARSGTTKRLGAFGPYMYVAVVTFLAIMVITFMWLYPYSSTGQNPCDTSDNSVVVLNGNLANGLDAFYGVNHLVAIVIAFISRKLPSFCGDSYSMYILSLISMLWIIADVLMGQAGRLKWGSNWTAIFYIIEVTTSLVVMTLAYLTLIFYRILYVSVSKKALLSEFLDMDLEIYEQMDPPSNSLSFLQSTYTTGNFNESSDLVRVKQQYGEPGSLNRPVSWPVLEGMVANKLEKCQSQS